MIHPVLGTNLVGSVGPITTPRIAQSPSEDVAPPQVADAFEASQGVPATATDSRAAALHTAHRVGGQVAATLVGGPAAAVVDAAVTVSEPDTAQKAVARHSNTFTTGRGYATYMKMFDARLPGEEPGPFGRAMEALRNKPGARWLDSGGGEGYATRQLKDADGYESLHTTLLSYQSSAEKAPGYDVLTGRFIEDIPSAELGKNDVVTDVYGPLAYSGRPHEVLRKYVDALKPDGQIFAFLGASREQFGEINKVATQGGRVLPFGEWLQTIPGLNVDLEKRPIVDDEGQKVAEAWIARITLDPEKTVAIPDLQTVWFEDGKQNEGYLVPRQVLVESGAHGPSPEQRARICSEAELALADRVDGQSTEQFLDAFRIGEFRNPLMSRLSSLGAGDEWVNVSPLAHRVEEDLGGPQGLSFDDPAYMGVSQWIMERRAQGIKRQEFTYTPSPDGADLRPGRGARLITDYNGSLLSSYAPDETLAKYVGALRDGGEAFVYLGLEKGGTGLEARIVTKDGEKLNLRGWLASIPGLDVDKYRGHTWRGAHFAQHMDENVFVRIRVTNPDEVRIPKLELLGTAEKSGDGVAIPTFREIA